MSRALLQAVPDAYLHATTGYLSDGRVPIDLDLARHQHEAVVEGMEWLGYRCTVLAPDGAGPDAVFVEDPVVLHGGRAVRLRSAHPGRAREGERLVAPLTAWGVELVPLAGSGHADGGDVLILGDHAFVGLSTRTDAEGARALASALGLALHTVELPGDALHLKCRASPLPGGQILATAAMARALGMPAVVVPDDEAYAANVVARGDRALVAEGHPRTAAALRDAGFEVRCLDLSELRKGDGSLTCLSIRED